MSRLLQWIVTHPRVCLSLAASLVLVLTPGLRHLQIDGTAESFLPAEDPAVEAFREIRANFGSDSFASVVVLAGDSGFFQADVLRTVKLLGERLERVPGVYRVVSIFTLPTPQVSGREIRVAPMVGGIPDTENELRELKDMALQNGIVSKLLVDKDATAGSLLVFLEEDAKRYDIAIATESIRETIAKVEKEATVPLSIFAVGAPIVTASAKEHIRTDLLMLGPAALVLIGWLAYWIFRSFLLSLIPLVTSVMSVIATLGVMGLLGFSVTSTVSVVVILIVVIGSTEDIHIISEYTSGVSSGLNPRSSILKAGQEIGSAIVLTAITTALGFLSILLSPVHALREFSIACTAGILLNFLITILVVPALLPISKFRASKRPLSQLRHHPVGKWISGRVERSCRGTILIASLVAVISLVGVFHLRVDSDYLRLFSKDSEVRRNYAKFASEFGGGVPLLVALETGRKNGVYDLKNLQAITHFHRQLEKELPHVFGLVEIISELNSVLPGMEIKDVRQKAIPQTQARMDELVPLFDKEMISSFVDYNASRTVLWVRTEAVGSLGMREVEETITAIAEKVLPPEIAFEITGEYVLVSRFSDQISGDLLKNIVLLFFSVAILISVFFRSVRIGLISLVPNAIPVLVTFGYMGWADIPLSTGTFAVGFIAFGIAVDDSIHLIARLRRERNMNGLAQSRDAVRNAVSKELVPILSTSLILIAGFSLLFLSDFQVHRETALLFVIAIAAALLSDLLLFPILLKDST